MKNVPRTYFKIYLKYIQKYFIYSVVKIYSFIIYYVMVFNTQDFFKSYFKNLEKRNLLFKSF